MGPKRIFHLSLARLQREESSPPPQLRHNKAINMLRGLGLPNRAFRPLSHGDDFNGSSARAFARAHWRV